MNIDRDAAETWGTWFKVLGDPTRIVILNLLATAHTPDEARPRSSTPSTSVSRQCRTT